MILANYIRKEIVATAALVTLVLAVILLGGRLMMYLGHAAEGRLLASLVFKMVLYRSPEFMQMILPLGYFMAILLTLGRMSVERELAICESAGVSLVWIGRCLIWVSLCLMAIVTSLSLYFGPLGIEQTDILFTQQAQRADFQVLAPGRFHPIAEGRGVTYVGKLDDDGRQMEDLFVAEVSDEQMSVVVAAQGKRQVFSSQGEEFLQLRTGRRYDLQPGKAAAKIIEFEGYRAKIADRRLDVQSTRIKSTSTLSLMNDASSAAKAELHWRLGLFFLIPNVTLLALALCRVNPRQGRFLRLFPAIGFYLLYLGIAMVVKSQIEKRGVAFVPALYFLHVGVLIGGMLSLMASDGRFRRIRGAS